MESPATALGRYWGADHQECQEAKSHSALLLERINAKVRARKERRQSLPNKTFNKVLISEGKNSALPLQLDHPPVNGSTKTLNGVRILQCGGEGEPVTNHKMGKKAKRKERLSLPLAENKGIVDEQFISEVTAVFKAKKKKNYKIEREENGDAVEKTDAKPGKKKKKKNKEEIEEVKLSLSMEDRKKNKFLKEENTEAVEETDFKSDTEKKKKRKQERKEAMKEDRVGLLLSQEVELSLPEGNGSQRDTSEKEENNEPVKETSLKPDTKKKKKRKQEKEEAVKEDSVGILLSQEIELSLPEGDVYQKDTSKKEENIEPVKETGLKPDKGKKKKKQKREREETMEEDIKEPSLSKKIKPLVPEGNQVEDSLVEVDRVKPEECQMDASTIEANVTLPKENKLKTFLLTKGSEGPDRETENTEKIGQVEVGDDEEEIKEVVKKKKKKKKSKIGEEAEATQEENVAVEEGQVNQEAVEEATTTTADKENEKEEGIQVAKERKKEKKKKKKSYEGEEMKIDVKGEQIVPEDIKEPVGTSADKENKEDSVQGIKKKERKKKRLELKLKGFTLLGEADSAKKSKVQRVLPHWLANPTLIQRNLQAGSSSIDSISTLHPKLIEKLMECKILSFFPVQRAVIPDILATASPLALRYQPQDICVSAPTGSGKTLAFVLPIVQALCKRVVPKIRALVLLPVQELALQVFRVFQTYCEPMGLTVGAAVGLKPFAKEQTTLFRQCYGGTRCLVDILVATPGRLSDHLRMTKGLDLSHLRYFVLDEADKMLATEGGDWIAHIEKEISQRNASLPTPDSTSISCTIREPLQRLLFSATLSHDPEQLQQVNLHHPRLYTVVLDETAPGTENGATTSAPAQMVGQYTRPSELTEQFVVVEASVKPLLLYHLITTHSWNRTLVFTNSLEATHKLAILLNELAGGTLRVFEFSSRHGKERHKIKAKFAAGKIDVLVSSDAMARGLDIPDIEQVVSYDVTSVSTYVHRIGRTARAGKEGTALSLVTKDSLKDFRSVLSNGGGSAKEISVPMSELESYEAAYVNALAKMKEVLELGKLKKEKKDTAIAQRRLKGSRYGKATKLNSAKPSNRLKGLKRLGRGVVGRRRH